MADPISLKDSDRLLTQSMGLASFQIVSKCRLLIAYWRETQNIGIHRDKYIL